MSFFFQKKVEYPFSILCIESTQYSNVHVLYSFTVWLYTPTNTSFFKILVKFRHVVCFHRRTTTFSTRSVTARGPDGGWPSLWFQENVPDCQTLWRAPTAVSSHSVLVREEVYFMGGFWLRLVFGKWTFIWMFILVCVH